MYGDMYRVRSGFKYIMFLFQHEAGDKLNNLTINSVGHIH